eukprot:1144747-Pelagomonas_calceolata.AAC.1
MANKIGAGVYCPLTNGIKFDVPNGAGITNSMCRAELAANAAAITHTLIHTLPQTVSPLFIKCANNLFTLRSTDNTFKETPLKPYLPSLATRKPILVSTN